MGSTLYDDNAIAAFDATASRASSLDDLAQGFLAALKPFGFTECAAATLSRTFREQPGEAIFLPYDNPDWYGLYVSERFMAIDPIAERCMRSPTPFIWREYLGECRLSAPQRRMLDAAAEHGHAHGLSVPVHGFGRAPGVVSVVAPDQFDRAAMHVAHLLAFRLFESAYRLTDPDRQSARRSTPNLLSPRERECLRWTALGKSSWEIGQILRVSDFTVRDHLASVRRKYGVHTTTQAVACCLVAGHIDL